jgi:hypothetical protein
VKARRGRGATAPNRVNLFAKVPDWRLSHCKSSAELLRRYGYASGVETKLYCTVGARGPNSRGLMLRVDSSADLLEEVFVKEGCPTDVVVWQMRDLRDRLVQAHPASVWVTALPEVRDGWEFFHYRHAFFTGQPRVELLPLLLREGTITVDHLIESRCGAVREKGPLFKMSPSNMSGLFEGIDNVRLMA